MLKSTRLDRRRSLKLPAQIFQPLDRVSVITEGNTVIVKKLSPSNLSELASRSRGAAMPLKEITKEINKYRKEKRK